MKRLLLLATAAMATTACAPGMFSIPARGYPLRPHYARPAAQAEPVPIGRWDNVMRLPRGSTVDVLTSDGAAHVGPTLASDVSSVRLVVDGSERRIDRRDIVRVDMVDLAGSEVRAVARKAARGALLGAGFAALVSGVVGGEAWPPPGPLLRGGAAVGGVAAGQAEVLRRSGRVIYVAPEPLRTILTRPMSSSSRPSPTVTCERPSVRVSGRTRLKR